MLGARSPHSDTLLVRTLSLVMQAMQVHLNTTKYIYTNDLYLNAISLKTFPSHKICQIFLIIHAMAHWSAENAIGNNNLPSVLRLIGSLVFVPIVIDCNNNKIKYLVRDRAMRSCATFSVSSYFIPDFSLVFAHDHRKKCTRCCSFPSGRPLPIIITTRDVSHFFASLLLIKCV